MRLICIHCPVCLEGCPVPSSLLGSAHMTSADSSAVALMSPRAGSTVPRFSQPFWGKNIILHIYTCQYIIFIIIFPKNGWISAHYWFTYLLCMKQATSLICSCLQSFVNAPAHCCPWFIYKPVLLPFLLAQHWGGGHKVELSSTYRRPAEQLKSLDFCPSKLHDTCVGYILSSIINYFHFLAILWCAFNVQHTHPFPTDDTINEDFFFFIIIVYL